ncbi:hypothetical protein ACFOEK_14590 [Litoribrevibacter euphylliae]|uniref:Lipoprotein n=1 Tax=Litoribrevibacter euphylliae TaxID=1834034 RepID=A0ABV7HIK2_9GAMM
MKRMLLSALVFAVQGCSTVPTESAHVAPQTCVGSTDLPQVLSTQFSAVTDTALLNDALGEKDQGKLCQGQVYESKENAQVKVFRAWNSTNPNSQYGQWWAFNEPAGSISAYRSDYEICYQWSPLDKMVSCTLKPGTKVVVGNGQSATCSQYLTYPVSAKQQVYIADAENVVMNCTEYNGVMSWE